MALMLDNRTSLLCSLHKCHALITGKEKVHWTSSLDIAHFIPKEGLIESDRLGPLGPLSPKSPACLL